MRLEGSGLTCVRGGREVFSGLGFSRRRRRGPAGHRPQRRRQILAAAHDRGPGPDRRRPAGAGRTAIPSGRIPEQAHYLGHQDALKPSLTVAENLEFWARYLGGGRAAAGRAGRGRPATRWPTCRPPTSRPASGGGCRIARLVAVQRPIWLLDEPTAALDREAQDTLAELMRAASRRRRADRRRRARPDRARTRARNCGSEQRA